MSDDIITFIGALAFNWVIAGTDAHSKNHSLLHGRGSVLRFAPLYDLASFLPYQRDPNSTKVKVSMKIGGTYRLHEIDAARWSKWAMEADLSRDRMIGIVGHTVQNILKSIDDVGAAIREDHDSPFLHKLVDGIRHRAASCAEMLP